MARFRVQRLISLFRDQAINLAEDLPQRLKYIFISSRDMKIVSCPTRFNTALPTIDVVEHGLQKCDGKIEDYFKVLPIARNGGFLPQDLNVIMKRRHVFI